LFFVKLLALILPATSPRSADSSGKPVKLRGLIWRVLAGDHRSQAKMLPNACDAADFERIAAIAAQKIKTQQKMANIAYETLENSFTVCIVRIRTNER
jgi:hypothetical protein